MLRRKVYKELLSWKENHVKTCLMIKGARQVGKTYIVREFGRSEYSSFIEINFIEHKDYKEIFSGNLSADEIYKRMTAYLPNIELIPSDTLIFLDEIQNCASARTALKFLAEDGKYDVITSGSLLGLTYAENGNIEAEEPESVPTGYEDFITMYSLDFEEFLWAEGYKQDAINIIRNYYEAKEKVPRALNEKYLELFREYIVVGGMPEVVADYVENHDYNRVTKLQERILTNYKFDISKYARGAEKTKVQSCYDAIPKQLAKELKKFQYSTVEKGQTRKKYGGSVQWLKDSALVHVSYNVKNPEIPLMANASEEQFKLYINDTGLLCATYGQETKLAILNKTIKGAAKGGIYENVISESLIKQGYNLFYHKPNDNRELEFLLEKNGEVIPVEVKAGNTATISLDDFIREYEPKEAFKFVDGNVGVADGKITLPHYMIIFL